MQTCRRLASTATSTSRSASSSTTTHSVSTGRLSRSSSTTSAVSPTMTPVDPAVYSRLPMAIPMARGLSSPTSTQRGSHFASPPTTTDHYTRAELETIAESLLAHVQFGPYHLASSPVPSSTLRLAMASHGHTKENSASSMHPNTSSTPTPGPSSRRHFEGKEGSHYHLESNNHHPRARFSIGGGEERGRGTGRKSVGLSVRDVNHEAGAYGFEREGRDRGRSGHIKGLQYP